MTGIPLNKVAESENQKLLKLDNILKKYIIGQNEAINSLTKAIRRSRTGLKNPSRPIGVFLFLGPTGVGKTELAKSLATNLFPHNEALIKVDMSEYRERFSLSRLIGAPPGYVGYEEGGELTEKVRRNPYSVILLDEIEKGHSDIFNVLLQVFDEGILTDGLGRKVDFKNSIIIMTSNIGTKNSQNIGYGFGSVDKNKNHAKMETEIMDSVKRIFSPELINRIDESIIFKSLNEVDVYKIIDLQILDLIENLRNLGLKIKINISAKKFLAIKGYDARYGVRALRRKIQKYLEDPISEILLKKTLDKGTIISVKALKEKIEFDLQKPKNKTKQDLKLMPK
jgi:ATP-dependent Clp protease ATP-binding subunit ClpC